MDLYTTSFTFPRPPPRSTRNTSSPLPPQLTLPGSSTISNIPLPNVTIATTPTSSPSTPLTTAAKIEDEWNSVQRMCLAITTREGCLVTVSKEQLGADYGGSPPTSATTAIDRDAPISGTILWNFHLSGAYQSVMAARGAILREIPRDNRITIKVARTDILESPLATVSPLKPDVRRCLDEIAADSHAHIAVLNIDIPGGGGLEGAILATADGSGVHTSVSHDGQEGMHTTTQDAQSTTRNGSSNGASAGQARKSNSPTVSRDEISASPAPYAPTNGSSVPVTYGLETERMCELVLTGSLECVEIAKVRLLVMLDELSGLHSEVCDIDYKLHPIIASRKRGVIQSIQEETATNIYYPTPLVGIHDTPQPGASQNTGYRHMGMGPLSMQSTGASMQLTGQLSLPGMGMNGGMNGMSGMNAMNGMNGMTGVHGMGLAMSGAVNGHGGGQMGGMAPSGTAGIGYPSHRGNNNPAPYNPHQHVHYPYSPQPLGISPQAARGMPYSGPGMHHYGAGALHGLGQPSGPLPIHNTGMSQMHTGYLNDRGMVNQVGMSMTPNANLNGHMEISGGNMATNHNGMSMGVTNILTPYANTGQSHLHVGLGAMPMGMNNGMPVGIGLNGGIGMTPSPGMGQVMGIGMGQYGTGPHPGLSVHGGEQGVLGKANQVWITGEFFGVQRARDMLLNVAAQKSKLVISRDTAILPRKLDWLLTERLEEVKGIMSDNGTYIQVPFIGSQASLITIFGDHRVNIERTIRSIMALACQFYVASFWLLPISFDVLMPQASLNPAQMQPILKRIAHTSGAEVVFKSNCFEMHGLEYEVRTAVMMVIELDIIHNFHHEIRFQIELANEHREFISGKKNGKINKIMKMAGVKIKFETFNDYNFLMDVSGNDLGALQGLSMLQEELPAEVSFHIPESYHKRIIGVGGKNIQRIMKLFGVYVKFSNAEEFAALGGYTDNEDNVVARTPAKNSMNLESLKQSVMELVNPKDKDYTVECISVPRRYHRTLLGEKSIFIHDIEHKTNSIVRFPYKESASDILTIFGPESQVHIAAAMLLDHVPFEADLHVPPNLELTRLVISPDFIVFAELVKRDHQIAIVPSPKFGQGDEAIFKFRCQRSNIDFLGTARDSLEEWLGQHNIQVYPSNAHKRVDTYMNAFSHFNSKLLATGGNAPDADGESMFERKSRPATVSTNVKALFDGPGGSYPSVDDSASLGFAGPLSYHDPRRAPDVWQAAGRPGSSTTRTDSESSKRDSDPIIQEKVRQASASHALSHANRAISARTQSLDITSLNFSRRLSGSHNAFGPIPPSPGPVSSSPNTATGQYFAAQSHLRPNSTGRGSSGYDGGMEGLSLGEFAWLADDRKSPQIYDII